MRKRLGRAPEPHATADIIPTIAAVITVTARHANLESNTVTSSQILHRRADCDNSTAGFMAEGKGLADEDVTVAVMAKVVEVGAAEAGGLDGDLDLVAGGGGELTLFLEVVMIVSIECLRI